MLGSCVRVCVYVCECVFMRWGFIPGLWHRDAANVSLWAKGVKAGITGGSPVCSQHGCRAPHSCTVCSGGEEKIAPTPRHFKKLSGMPDACKRQV